MPISPSPAISHIEAPPIAEAMSWVRPGERNRPFLNLCQAVPSYPPAEELQAEIARLATLPATGLYTDIFGLPALREALAAHSAADYRGDIAAEDVCITSGCNQAFCAAVMAIAGRGDNVVLPVPYYFNHKMWLDMLGIESRPIPAFGKNPWPEPEDAEQLIDAKSRAIILCSPNNPTGAIYPDAVLGAFHDLARQHGIALVIDETYKDFRPSPGPLHGLFARPGWRDSFIHLYSFSKVFAMTGYRTGAIIAGEAVLREAEKILDCMAICAPHISQAAAAFGLGHLDGWKAGKKALMEHRLAALRRAFETPGLGYRLVSAGAYFAYVEHPFAGVSAKDVARRLAGEHDLLTLPGSMFGPGQDRYLRLAFANADAELMPELAARLIGSQTSAMS